MIRTALRVLKHFLLRHAGIIRLAENDCTILRELASMRSALESQVCALRQLEELRSLREGQNQALQQMAELKPLLDSQSRVIQCLDELRSLRNEQAELLERVNELRPLLAEQANSLRQLGEFNSLLDGQVILLQRLTEAVPRSVEELRQAFRGLTMEVQHRGEELRGLVETGVEKQLQCVGAPLAEVQRLSQALNQLVDRHDAVATTIAHIRSWELDKWKIQEYEGLVRYLRKKQYLQEIESGSLPVPHLATEHPVAVYSNDTRYPRGCRNDNSICLRFNRKLYALLGERARIKILDLGCAGGGLVRSLLDDGHFAVGLEGSDYPLKNQTGEWATIPFHLFTCDVTEPFRLTDARSGEALQFDAVTAWEVMEHIPEERLSGLFANLERHLGPGGYLLFSIATFVDRDDRTGVVWHVTVKPREWWVNQFLEAGFVVEDLHPFVKGDWLRGSGNCRGDWREDDGVGFHVVLRRRRQALPTPCSAAAA